MTLFTPLPSSLPQPEVVPKATRRKFTAAYKLRTLQTLDDLKGSGDIGAFLREEGLYSAQISAWRKDLEEGGPAALEPKVRGRHKKPDAQKETESALTQVERENARLKKQLAQAHAIIEVQKKVAALLSSLEHES